MYEQNDVPVFRRILWIGLWFVIAVIIIGVLTWLIFFQHNAKKTVAPHKAATQSHVSKPATPSPSTTSDNSDGHILSTSTNTPSTSATNPANSTQTNASSTPTELVNTGAGNVIALFSFATVAGTAFQYIRTRRKLVN